MSHIKFLSRHLFLYHADARRGAESARPTLNTNIDAVTGESIAHEYLGRIVFGRRRLRPALQQEEGAPLRHVLQPLDHAGGGLAPLHLGADQPRVRPDNVLEHIAADPV